MHVRPLSAHTRFILRRGIVPWGIIVGIVAAGLVLHDAYKPAEMSAGSGAGQIALMAVLCFLEWSFGAGWVIGAVLWTAASGKASETSRKGQAS
jgi:hypothetical protein